MPNPNKSPSASRRLPGLDVLRLLAALAVVAYHGLFRGPHSDGYGGARFPGLEDVAVYGCLGVDLFFVISGYVIAWSSEGRGALSFARARILRLWPGFAFCMTLSALVLWLAQDPNFPISGRQWLANLMFAPQLFHQPFVDGAYWTIVAELTFYGWVFLAIATGLFPRRLIALGWLWLAVATANHVWLHSGVVKHVLLTNYAGEFLGGILLYRIGRGRGDFATYALLAASVVAAVGFGAVTEIRDFHLGLGYAMNAPVMYALTLSAFALVAVASRLRLDGRAANIALVAGGLTYPTYLLHQDIEYVLPAKLVALGVSPLAALLLVAAGVLVVAFAVFRWVEPAGKALLVWAIDAPASAVRRLARLARREGKTAGGFDWLFSETRVRTN
jgi:peptidoglycan/LPS O-acetylase OafA/YrhL